MSRWRSRSPPISPGDPRSPSPTSPSPTGSSHCSSSSISQTGLSSSSYPSWMAWTIQPPFPFTQLSNVSSTGTTVPLRKSRPMLWPPPPRPPNHLPRRRRKRERRRRERRRRRRRSRPLEPATIAERRDIGTGTVQRRRSRTNLAVAC